MRSVRFILVVCALSLVPVPAPAQTQVPAPTIVNDPDLRVRGTGGGESDGKTIGIDGQPLAAHSIYANDSQFFADRVDLGIKALMTSVQRERYNELKKILRPLDNQYQVVDADGPERKQQLESYKNRFLKEANQEPCYELARRMADLDAAMLLYQRYTATINYEEKIRVKDRIDLDQAPSASGQEHREIMKMSIQIMQESRAAILKDFAPYYDEGKKQQEAQSAAVRAAEKFSTVKVADAQLFAYQTFERTPMAAGLLAASRGQKLLTAKPIFLPKGARVQVLEEQTIKVSEAGGASTSLNVAKIQVNTPGMRQHDGKALPAFTLSGWVLKDQLDIVK